MEMTRHKTLTVAVAGGSGKATFSFRQLKFKVALNYTGINIFHRGAIEP